MTPSVGGARIGIFGGSFDPIHLAHLRAAEAVRERCGLDEIRFVLSATPPHKAAADMASAADRLHMLRLALEGASELKPSAMEAERGGVSYSIDTVRQVLRERPAPARLVLIVGGDVFRDLPTWKQYAQLFEHCDVVVHSRPGNDAPLTLDDFPVACRNRFCYDALRDCFRHDSGHTVQHCRVPLLQISSTEIRRLVSQGRSIRFLVPPQVERYILERGLYRTAVRSTGQGGCPA